MKKNREYAQEQFHYLAEDFKEFAINPLLGKSANDILEYFFIIFGGFFIFFVILLPANIIGIFLTCVGYYKWLDEKRNGALSGFGD